MNDNKNDGHTGRSKKVLQLELSRTARAFQENESLWNDELEHMFRLIRDHYDSLDKLNGGGSDEESPLLSIAIFGSPGSGKTSMIKTFERMSMQQTVSNKFLKEIEGRIYSLPLITPNHQVGDDHFLYTFLATALNAYRSEMEKKEQQSGSSSILTSVQQKFQEVSEYLQVLNDTDSTQDDDPLGVSLNRLERHESDFLLRKKLYEFIDELCDGLRGKVGKSLLLMPVDDADLSLKVLNSSLDTYWRYLQHPRLIPIFTFTGRLAEELLRVRFEENLSSETFPEATNKLKEVSSTLMITESMAIQFLTRLFPVRNRIQLGPISARVLEAEYKTSRHSKPRSILKLLEKYSSLLFGNSFQLVPKIRAPLRMTTLRRQLQIVDAMQEQEIEIDSSDIDAKLAAADFVLDWTQTFGKATWAMLNSHRDILKELDINFDDLYSWTPQGLRWVLLDSILKLKPHDRRELLNFWYYRSEDRRSLVISLLAADVFRPRTGDNEKSSDDSYLYRLQSDEKNHQHNVEKRKNYFNVGHGALWFVRLCIGFYLPQVLSANREERIYGVGWGLTSGPGHAIRAAISDKRIYSTGVMFLDPKQLSLLFESDPDTALFLNLWCFYGCKGDQIWAAISLWRGLGLLGRLLEIENDYLHVPDDPNKKELIEKHLIKHLQEALVVENLPSGRQSNNEWKDLSFSFNDYTKNKKLKKLIVSLMAWLRKYRLSDKNLPNETNRIFNIPIYDELDWEKSFIRRIHGEHIMSLFFRELDKLFLKLPITDWDTSSLFAEWLNLLKIYWNNCIGEIDNVFLNCPLFSQFPKDCNIKVCSQEDFHVQPSTP